MDRLFQSLLGRLIRHGMLHVTTVRGRTFTVGDGTGKPVALRFTSMAAQLGIVFDPELRLGGAYMDRGFVIEQGSIADMLALALAQDHGNMPGRWARPLWLARYLWRRLQQFNPPSRARRNAAHHYDLDGHLYSLFLDADRQYSCAYFEAGDLSLDDAQLAKKRHLAAKLKIEPECRVLDIGSGWGGPRPHPPRGCGGRGTRHPIFRGAVAASAGPA